MWVSPMINTAYVRGKTGGLQETDLFGTVGLGRGALAEGATPSTSPGRRLADRPRWSRVGVGRCVAGLADMPRGFTSAEVGDRARKLWETQLELPREKRAFGRGVIWQIVKNNIRFAVSMHVSNAITQLVSPMLLKAMLTWCAKAYACQLAAGAAPGAAVPCEGASIAEGLLIVAGFALNTLAGGFFKSHAFMQMLNGGILAKTAATTLTFDKALRMSAKGRAATSQGAAVNLLANDAEKLMMGLFAIMSLASTPIILTVSLIMLYNEVQGAARLCETARLLSPLRTPQLLAAPHGADTPSLTMTARLRSAENTVRRASRAR